MNTSWISMAMTELWDVQFNFMQSFQNYMGYGETKFVPKIFKN